jgi:hypothetical protein
MASTKRSRTEEVLEEKESDSYDSDATQPYIRPKNVLYLCATDASKKLIPPKMKFAVDTLFDEDDSVDTYWAGMDLHAEAPSECTVNLENTEELAACGYPDESFDTVISEMCPVTLFREEQTLKNVHRIIAPGGVLLIQDLKQECYDADINNLKQLLKIAKNDDTPEGLMHAETIFHQLANRKKENLLRQPHKNMPLYFQFIKNIPFEGRGRLTVKVYRRVG